MASSGTTRRPRNSSPASTAAPRSSRGSASGSASSSSPATRPRRSTPATPNSPVARGLRRRYAGRDGDFTLYEDDGVSYGDERGTGVSTRLHWNDATGTLTGTGGDRAPARPATGLVQVIGRCAPPLTDARAAVQFRQLSSTMSVTCAVETACCWCLFSHWNSCSHRCLPPRCARLAT
ncbi:MAG: DUF5110 domain-containing protein [Gemmatimonadaceae bacterium]|nr:DUF5110 domain-containing protein [Gemmatimonadaceae bacterium]